MSSIPKWLERHLNAENRVLVEDAIASVEKSSSVEIVPVIVKRSSTVSHVPVNLFLLLICLGLLFGDYFYILPWVNSGLIYLGLGILSLILSMGLSRFDRVSMLFTPEADRNLQVLQRAELEFYRNKLGQTRDKTGVLVFISVAERRVQVLADETVSKRLPEDTWDKFVEIILQHKKQGLLAKGIAEAILWSGDLMKKEFPIQPQDVNELPNKLIILD